MCFEREKKDKIPSIPFNEFIEKTNLSSSKIDKFKVIREYLDFSKNKEKELKEKISNIDLNLENFEITFINNLNQNDLNLEIENIKEENNLLKDKIKLMEYEYNLLYLKYNLEY